MSCPKRIVISINTSWNVYNFRAGLVRALRDAGYEVVALAPRDEYSERLADLGVRHVALAMDNKGTSPFRDLGLLVRYLRLLRRERPDIFLGYTIKPNIYGSLAAGFLGIPVINNVSGLGTVFIKASWITRIVGLLYRIAFRYSHRVFFQNDDDRSLFVRKGIVSHEKTRIVPGSGIDLEKFRPLARPDEEPITFKFLLIARLLWDKGVGEFVEAARIVKREVPQARFVLLGFLDVENRTAIPKEAVEEWSREGVVEYLGAAEDVRSHIAASDCVVLPSYREGLSRTLLEAAAMARPLIASDVPGCREVVDDGTNGFLCAVQSADDLARCMIEFANLSDRERSYMGQASRLKVERNFDERLVVDEYLKAVSSAVDRFDDLPVLAK